ncbi:N-acetylmuramoyl-L-alanine amidase AmiB, partial [Acinetobacter baumannii]|nr:N-acetylmuramoyl-L-alanine amidase AmiB [Acinetobacter baumannii]
TEDGKTRAVKQQNGANYTVGFTINADAPPPPPPPVVVKRADPPPVTPSRTTTSGRNPFSSSGHERQTVMTSSQPAMTNN